MQVSTPGPLPVAERIATLDILRGFALMGILIMNMPGFANSMFAEADGSRLWPGAVDVWAGELRDMLFGGKFNSMFSMLFGIGFTIQYGRMTERDPVRGPWLYLRRLIVLLAIGVLHATVFWPGDVLHTYAMLGLLMLVALRRLDDRGILALIILCLVYPVLSGALRLAIVTPEITAQLVARAKAYEASGNLAFGQGGFLDAARESARIMAHFYGDRWSLWGALGWNVQLMLTMLIGLLAGRRRWVQRAPELMPRIRPLTWLMLAVGLACSAASTLIFASHRVPGPSLIKMLGGLCYWTARPAMMLFYALLIVQLAHSLKWRHVLAPFAEAGRMPLTNYLMQTAICITVFHHWGFGLWGRVGPAWQLVMSLTLFFGIQVPLSRWWLKHHERGPMEALWSRLTYGRQATPAPAAVATRQG